MNDKWLLVTAGFSSDLVGAAQRVQRQALNLELFDTLMIDMDNLPLLCPNYVEKYKQFLNPGVRGFGYFGWKPAIIDAILNSNTSRYSGLIWVDAGCEIFPTIWTRKTLKSWMNSAKKTGFWGFSLDTPERLFTKRDLFDHFPTIKSSDESAQIQATYLILHGSKGREIAAKWNEVSMIDISLLDLTKSFSGETNDFIEHRSDQSILSLVIKSMGLQASNAKPKPGLSGPRAIISALRLPIWTSRNRTPNSIVPPLLSAVGLLTLRVGKKSFLRRESEIYQSVKL